MPRNTRLFRRELLRIFYPDCRSKPLSTDTMQLENPREVRMRLTNKTSS